MLIIGHFLAELNFWDNFAFQWKIFRWHPASAKILMFREFLRLTVQSIFIFTTIDMFCNFWSSRWWIAIVARSNSLASDTPLSRIKALRARRPLQEYSPSASWIWARTYPPDFRKASFLSSRFLKHFPARPNSGNLAETLEEFQTLCSRFFSWRLEFFLGMC